MLNINISDVINIIKTCIPQLVFFAIVLVVSIVAMIACRKMQEKNKYMVRSQAVVAIVLALVITVNLICFGPMSTIISLAMGNGSISEETSATSEKLGEKIAEEGIL